MESIRLAGPGDARAIAAIYAPIVRETPISFETAVPDGDEMRGRIAGKLPAHPWLVHERDGEVAGYAYAGPNRTRAAYQWSVDVSVYVHEDHRGAGVGRGLYESLFALLREQGFYNAYAGIALPNEASVGLHEAMGFELVGVYEDVGYKHGAWHDVGWWAKTLRAHDDGPAPPRMIDDLGEETVARALESGLGSIRG